MNADTAALSDAATPIAEEARKTFSLAEALSNVKLKSKKLVLFTDEQTVTEYANAERELALTEGRLADADLTPEMRAHYTAQLDTFEQRKADARTAMLASALSVHMRAVPDVVMDAGRRAARKAYAVNGVVDDEHLEAANALQQRYVLGRVIQKVVNAAGAEADFDRDKIAEELRAALPLSQWQRIVATYNEIVFTDAIGAQATLDPGF